MQTSSQGFSLEHVESMGVYVGMIMREEISSSWVNLTVQSSSGSDKRKHLKAITNRQFSDSTPFLQSLLKLAPLFILDTTLSF